MNTNTNDDEEEPGERRKCRDSKQTARYRSKLILETLANDDNLKDLSDDDASDYEEELRKERHKKGLFTDDDETEQR